MPALRSPYVRPITYYAGISNPTSFPSCPMQIIHPKKIEYAQEKFITNFSPSLLSNQDFHHCLLLCCTAPFDVVTLPLPLNANLRPTLPKHTQLQNNTLRIQMPPSILSLLTNPMTLSSPNRRVCFNVEFRGREVEDAGEGIMSGLEASRRAVPVAPTALERRKPGVERSTRYQRTGLTRARVREA